jgi:hypothetical protein
MTATTERRAGAGPVPRGVMWAGPASIGAGILHASAVGAHGEHRATAVAFALLAVFQVGWGVLALTRPGRRLLGAGVAGNGLAVLGWLGAKTTGIGLIDGLEAAEPPGLPDTLAAVLAVAAVAGALVALLAPERVGRPAGATARVPAAAATAVLVVAGMVATGGHSHGTGGHGHGEGELAAAHEHGDGDGHGEGGEHDHGDGSGGDHDHTDGTGDSHGDHDDDGTGRPAARSRHGDHDHTGTTTGDHDHTGTTTGDHDHPPGTDPHDHEPGTDPHEHPPGTDPGHHPGGGGTVPPRAYDGTLPVDLSGVPGVSAEQQAWAERLVTSTIQQLPAFQSTDAAYAAGYRAIGDAPTGYEHWINWQYLADGRQFDAAFPESLVYRVTGGQRTLEAAMYLLNPGTTLDTAPDLGGPLVQYHVHDNLCWYGDENNWQVALADPIPAPCPEGYHRRAVEPMVHVWIVGNPCGPFAALEGVGGGQVRPGEPVSCDHAHGSH